MSQLVQVSKQADQIKSIFKVNHDRMVRMAPRTTGDPNRLLTVAFNSIVYNSDLVQCTPASLFGGVLEALKLGLTIGGPMQESWLVPFRNKGVQEATLIIGYQGYRTLIDRAKSVMDLHPRAVYANDEFDFQFGTHPKVHHIPYWRVGKPAPGELIAVYAVAHLRGGGVQIEVMPKAEVDQHRAKSRAKDSGPWVNFYDAMALKTVVRKIAKYLPKSSELMARALQLDEQADLGIPQEFEVEGLVLDVPTELPTVPAAKQIGGTQVEALKEQIKAKAKPAEAPAKPTGHIAEPFEHPPAPAAPAHPPGSAAEALFAEDPNDDSWVLEADKKRRG